MGRISSTKAIAQDEQQLLDIVAMHYEQSRDASLLASVFAVSTACRSFCLELLNKHVKPTDIVTCMRCEAQLQNISSRQWAAMLNIAARTAVSSDTALAALVLLTTANLPQKDARKAIEAGLRVSCDQLVLAARMRIPGIEVWPRAHRLEPVISSWGHYVPGATNDMESFVECICCAFEGAGYTLLEKLFPNKATFSRELLYVAVNLSLEPVSSFVFGSNILCTRWYGPSLPAGSIPKMVDLVVLHELLVTAVARCNHLAFCVLGSVPGSELLVSDNYTSPVGPRWTLNLPDAQIVTNLTALSEFIKSDEYRVHQETLDILLQLFKFVCGNNAFEAAMARVK